MIVIGLLITLYLLHKDKQLKKVISDEQLANIFQISFFSGIIGGRVWFLITNPEILDNWKNCFTVWQGGLSILGAIIAGIIFLSAYLHYAKLPVLQILDRIALYMPLLQSISRLGCFFAGCCFGKATNLPWGIVYNHYDSLAPLGIALHPTQIYSSLFLAVSFIILLIFDTYYRYKQSGQIVTLYIMLISLDRFFIDFFRGDQQFFSGHEIFNNLAIQQVLAIFLFTTAFIMMLFISMYKKTNESI
jgi:phosphatidylglycerol:prolipoprotein diacylglycerol transferase